MSGVMEGGMAKTALENYHSRMRRVLDHIDQHLDEDLSVETLSGVAAFSMHHFHRQFSATFGVSVYRYVQLARMKRASYQLAYDGHTDVTEIAMDAGYQSPDAFARAFRKRIGQAPSEFRKSPDWEPQLTAVWPLTRARSKLMKTYSQNDVMIQEFPATLVAIMEHRGTPERLQQTIQSFVTWRKAVGLGRDNSATFTVFHSPQASSGDDYRVDLCAATDRPIPTNVHGVVAGLIPGGRCAVLRVVGESENLEVPALFLYRDWLPASGEETRDFPLFCQRVSFYPDVPENATITDLLLPLSVHPGTS
jgi:AraC family transcriptional regulator